MAQWSRGNVWEPKPSPPDGYDSSKWIGVDASVNYPEFYIDGIRRTTIGFDATWTTGRQWWMAAPEAGHASVTLRDEVTDIEVGDSFVISGDPHGVIWTGRVDGVEVDILPGTPDETAKTTRVTASDWLAVLGATETVAGHALNFGPQTLPQRLAALATYVGVPAAYRTLPPEFFPILDLQNGVTGNLLDYLADCERASNAIVGIDPDGKWSVLTRAGLPAGGGDPPSVPLTEGEDPFAATVAISSPDRIINSWVLGTTAAAPKDIAASITKYGRRTYQALSKSAATPIWAADGTGVYYGGPGSTSGTGFLDALAGPFPYATVRVRVQNRNSPLIGIKTFDYVAFRDKVWQVIASEWTVEPMEDGATGWEVLLVLDATQNEIGARPPIAPPIPPHVVNVTDVYAPTKDSFVVQTPGGSKYGNGGGPSILVGKLTDGNLTRGLVQFGISWVGSKNRKVTSATLRLTTSTFTCMSPPSSPEIAVSRVTGGGWSEGSYAVSCGFGSSNAVVFPGPGITTAGQVTKAVPKADTTAVDIDVTAMVRAWSDGAPNYGFALRGRSESNSDDRCEFRGKTDGTTARQPTLTIKYTYEE